MAQRQNDPGLSRDDDLARIRLMLGESRVVDAQRIDVVRAGDAVVLRGWVAQPEHVSVALTIAETAVETPARIVDELQVDEGLREGIDEQPRGERTIPAENEILVGDPDMLAGPDAMTEDDIGRAVDESLPYAPPDEAILPVAHEADRGVEQRYGRAEEVATAEETPAAADLSAPDLRAGNAPSLVPDPAPRTQADAQKVSTDALGLAPDDESLEPMVEQVPGTAQGPGAVGEHTTGGGSAGSVAATETGATGADSDFPRED